MVSAIILTDKRISTMIRDCRIFVPTTSRPVSGAANKFEVPAEAIHPCFQVECKVWIRIAPHAPNSISFSCGSASRASKETTPHIRNRSCGR
eukprot:2676530-Prymnesium_polylepis.1